MHPSGMLSYFTHSSLVFKANTTTLQARGIEENYDSDSDRAFESLWAWFWQRQSATTQPLYVIIESLEHIGINAKHVEAIKVVLQQFVVYSLAAHSSVEIMLLPRFCCSMYKNMGRFGRGRGRRHQERGIGPSGNKQPNNGLAPHLWS